MFQVIAQLPPPGAGEASPPADAPAPTDTPSASAAPAADGSAASADAPPLDIDHLTNTVGRILTETPLSNWIVLLCGIFGGLVLGKLASMLLHSIGDRLSRRNAELRATIFESAAAPASLGLFTAGLAFGLSPFLLRLEPGVVTFAVGIIRLLYIIAFGWFIFNLAAPADEQDREQAR